MAVVELQRILHDENELPWDEAWGIVTQTMAYTNHTLLPEALEKWSVPRFSKSPAPSFLPSIFEINKRLIETIEVAYPGDADKKRSMSLIEEGGVQMVRMANLAVVGSHSVNGVAAHHTELLKKHPLRRLRCFLSPARINNKTNGITPRRWLLGLQPAKLSNLITSKIGDCLGSGVPR